MVYCVADNLNTVVYFVRNAGYIHGFYSHLGAIYAKSPINRRR